MALRSLPASAAMVNEIKAATSHIEADWIKAVSAKGVNGAQVMKDLRAEVASIEN